MLVQRNYFACVARVACVALGGNRASGLTLDVTEEVKYSSFIGFVLLVFVLTFKCRVSDICNMETVNTRHNE